MSMPLFAHRNNKKKGDHHRSACFLTVKVRKNSRQTPNTHKKNPLPKDVLNTNMRKKSE
jgi:hypothetical protein